MWKHNVWRGCKTTPTEVYFVKAPILESKTVCSPWWLQQSNSLRLIHTEWLRHRHRNVWRANGYATHSALHSARQKSKVLICEVKIISIVYLWKCGVGRDMHHPLGPIQQTFDQIIDWCPASWVGAPLYGKSWIGHYMVVLEVCFNPTRKKYKLLSFPDMVPILIKVT